MSDIYSDLILENYKYPKNFGEMDDATSSSTVNNISCGDELTVYLKIENDRVKEILYTGSGCAICLGTMSIFSEYIKDRHIEELKQLDNNFILNLINMDEDSGRIKCATLSLDTVKKCINHE